MHIFLGWSGNKGRAVADLVQDWMKCVLQASKPMIPTRDMDRGSLWFAEVSVHLKNSSMGIIFLTKEMLKSSWIYFATGIMAQGINPSKIIVFLIDVRPNELTCPFAQFKHITPDQGGIRDLFMFINSTLEQSALPSFTFEEVFATYWNQYQSRLVGLKTEFPAIQTIKDKSEKQLLEEILETTRYLQIRVRNLETTRIPRAIAYTED